MYVVELEIDCRAALRRNEAQLTLQDTDDAKNGRRIDYFTAILLNTPPLMLILNKPGAGKARTQYIAVDTIFLREGVKVGREGGGSEGVILKFSYSMFSTVLLLNPVGDEHRGV